VLLAGCVAETVHKQVPRLGPVKAVGYVDMGGGEVRYCADGWSWFVAGRRRAARALMRHICGKLEPVVTEEFTQEDADVPYSQEDIAVTMQLGAEHFTLAPYTHMVFQCAYSSTAPVTAQPQNVLPPPPRPMVEAYAPGYSSATAATAGAGGAAAVAQVAASSAPAASAVPAAAVSFSSAPATPALKATPSAALPRAQMSIPPAAAWTAFPAGWTPAAAPPKISVSSAAPSAVPSGVNYP
jgi:hypothetical protein